MLGALELLVVGLVLPVVPACVVIVEVRGGTVVPGRVVTDSDVASITVLPETTVEPAVSTLIVVGGIVVPGIVVVKVTCSPRAVSGITFPTPDPVNWVGSVSVDVFGRDGEDSDP